MEWLTVGTQVGFAPNKLGKLWNGLAKLALREQMPRDGDGAVAIRVRLDDEHDVRVLVDVRADLREVRREEVEVDLGPRAFVQHGQRSPDRNRSGADACR